MPVYNADNEVCGTVFVCAESVMLTELLEVIIKTIVVSILWVLLAALIAVYFITEKITGPLKEISRAAKQFANGKFDVRVPVRGNDEVSELAVAVNNMAQSLDRYDDMRNTFMSNVSHDLRSPMTSISGFIDGILDGVIPPEKHEYYLRIVSTEIKRLSRLVSSLLDLSRIQAGDRKFTTVDFDICETARQILISFEKKIDEKKLDVEFDIQEERMIAKADSDAIHQVLYNLCDNAVKFAQEEGKLRIAIKKIKGKKLLVEVFNEGQGISPADINYVFERFYKSDKSRGLNKTGAGLGLFISKTIMDAHDEKIWVESEYGKNCCFRFTLTSE
jgi:signal transduction histidine kinase